MLSIRDALHEFNMARAADARTTQVMLPLRDGLSIAMLRGLHSGLLCDDEPAQSSDVSDLCTSNGKTTDVQRYMRLVGSLEPPPLRALVEETAAIMPNAAHMMSGAQQGRFIHMLVRLARAQRVLEIGCFTGYAAMWIAAALPHGGELVSCEHDERVAEIARRHLASSSLSSRVEICVGDALETLEALPADTAPFDLIFLDADKKRYKQYSDLLLQRGLISPDGALLSDNVLWKWQVLELLGSTKESRAATAAAAAVLPGRERFAVP